MIDKRTVHEVAAALICDVDGVFVHSEPRHRRKNEILIKTHFDHDITANDWTILHGRGDRAIFNHFASQYPDVKLTIDDYIAECDHAYINVPEKLQPRRDIRLTIKEWRKRNLPVAIATNGSQITLDFNLNAVGLTRDDFDFIMDATELTKFPKLPRKPDPAYFRHVALELLRKTGAILQDNDPRRMIVWEDSPEAIQSVKQGSGFTALQWLLPPEMNVPASPFADHVLKPDDSPFGYLIERSYSRWPKSKPV
ncbi:MAG TPA: HAD family phosphatase [Alphaproteobacteria bacterium]